MMKEMMERKKVAKYEEGKQPKPIPVRTPEKFSPHSPTEVPPNFSPHSPTEAPPKFIPHSPTEAPPSGTKDAPH